MTKANHRWLIVVGALVFLAFVVPFTLLTNVDAWYGSFLFWTVLTAAVIGINAFISSSWRD